MNNLAKFVCYLLLGNVSREILVVVQKKPRQYYAKSNLLYKLLDIKTTSWNQLLYKLEAIVTVKIQHERQ